MMLVTPPFRATVRLLTAVILATVFTATAYGQRRVGLQDSALPPDLVLQDSQSPNPHRRAHAARELKRFAVDTAVPILIELLGDSDPYVQRSAVRTLSTFGPSAAPALPHLIEIARRESGELVTLAITAIGTNGKTAEAVVPALEEQLQRGQKYTLNSILRALISIGTADARRVVIDYYEQGASWRQTRLLELMSQPEHREPIDSQWMPWLIELLRQAKSLEHRARAAQALAQFGVDALEVRPDVEALRAIPVENFSDDLSNQGHFANLILIRLNRPGPPKRVTEEMLATNELIVRSAFSRKQPNWSTVHSSLRALRVGQPLPRMPDRQLIPQLIRVFRLAPEGEESMRAAAWHVLAHFADAPEIVKLAEDLLNAGEVDPQVLEALFELFNRSRPGLSAETVSTMFEPYCREDGYRHTCQGLAVALSRVAKSDDIPLLIDIVRESYSFAGWPPDTQAGLRDAFKRFPEASKVALRAALERAIQPPRWPDEIIEFVASTLAALDDQEAIPLIVKSGNGRRWVEEALIALDSTAAIDVLRQIDGGYDYRVRIGDPSAIDPLFQSAAEYNRTPRPRCGTGTMGPLSLQRYLGCFDGTDCVKWWQENRQTFVDAFAARYGAG